MTDYVFAAPGTCHHIFEIQDGECVDWYVMGVVAWEIVGSRAEPINTRELVRTQRGEIHMIQHPDFTCEVTYPEDKAEFFVSFDLALKALKLDLDEVLQLRPGTMPGVAKARTVSPTEAEPNEAAGSKPQKTTKSLRDLGVSGRAVVPLGEQLDVTCLEDLCGHSRKTVADVKGVSRESMKKLVGMMEDAGLYFADEAPPEEEAPEKPKRRSIL